jgi:hypothetical protein
MKLFHRTLITFFLTAGLAAAGDEPRGQRGESLGDFKAAVAAARLSCDEIPYKAQREKCLDRAAEVTTRCKEEAWSCDKPGPDGKPLDPTALKAKLAQTEEQLANLKAEKARREVEVGNITEAKDDAKREVLRKEIKRLADEIAKLEKVAADSHNELQDKERFVGDKMFADETCISLRDQLILNLGEARSYAGNEDQAAIAPLAKKLVARYDDAKAKHSAASDGYTAAKSKCEDLKRKF